MSAWSADILKYGPARLAAFVAAATVGLLTIELQRPGDLRESARRSIRGFMLFSMILVILSFGTSLLDTIYFAKDRQLSTIREMVRSLNDNVLAKTRDQRSSLGHLDPAAADRIDGFYVPICGEINEIARAASSSAVCDPAPARSSPH
jgi:hypothetical protein